MPNLAIIPASAVSDPDLTDTQLRVLCAVGMFTNRLGGNVWASVSTLAKASALSTRTVQRALPVLLGKGYLRHLTRPGRTNLYEVVLDRGVTTESGGGDTVVGGGVTTQSPKREEERLTQRTAKAVLDDAVFQDAMSIIWKHYPKRPEPYPFVAARRAVADAVIAGAPIQRLVTAAAQYGVSVVREKVEPRFVRGIVSFYRDGMWEAFAAVLVQGRSREEWARSGQDVAEFDRLAKGAS